MDVGVNKLSTRIIYDPGKKKLGYDTSSGGG